MGVEVVRCDHLGDLVRVDARIRREVLGCREMTNASIAARDRLVGHALDECLQEPELSAFGGEGICVHGEQLLAHEARDQAVDVVLREIRECREPPCGKGLAQYGRVLKQPALLDRNAVES